MPFMELNSVLSYEFSVFLFETCLFLLSKDIQDATRGTSQVSVVSICTDYKAFYAITLFVLSFVLILFKTMLKTKKALTAILVSVLMQCFHNGSSCMCVFLFPYWSVTLLQVAQD